MSHTIKEKGKLLSRVRRIRGQVEALERALEDERGLRGGHAADCRYTRRHQWSDGRSD